MEGNKKICLILATIIASGLVFLLLCQDKAVIKVFDNQDQSKSSFIVLPQNFRGEANIAVADLNNDEVFNVLDQIQASRALDDYAAILGGSETAETGRVSGAEINSRRQNESAKIIYPSALGSNFAGPKKIVVDISEQKLKAYAGEKLFLETQVSTGQYSMPTPLGNFKILNKYPRAWSSRYGLYMPYWMAFTTRGHGLHELPEWPGGYKEGADHLGQRVSHGCVRLGVGAAKKLYDWAEVGTAVSVQN